MPGHAVLLLSSLASFLSPPTLTRHVTGVPPRHGSAPLLVVTADPVADLHAWLEGKGVSTAVVHGAGVPGFGLSLVAKTDIEVGATLLSVPRSMHITPSATKQTPLGQAVDALLGADDSALLALGLLQEVGRGEASAWAPYVRMLVAQIDDLDVPLLWPDEQRASLLGGSHLDDRVAEIRQLLLEQWAAIEAGPMQAAPELFPPEAFNPAMYLWAHAVALSRALPFGEELSLIPFMDLANHESGAPNQCSIAVASGKEGEAPTLVTEQWQLDSLSGEPTAVLTAAAPCAAGEQVVTRVAHVGRRVARVGT